MTKAAKARRQRAEKRELDLLRHLVSGLRFPGHHTEVANGVLLGEVTHMALETANRLGFALVLQRDHSSERTWRFKAVPK